MKVVILAGGLGTRLAEETQLRPKPMVEIGGKPILWHIMKIYAQHGLTDFIVCCGYRGYVIKEYFDNYALHGSDLTIDLATGRQTVHHRSSDPWKVTLVDTGEHTQTGGRLRRVADYLGDEPFAFTYGDAVADIDVAASIALHRHSGRLATVTAVKPRPRFGALNIEGGVVTHFEEKPLASEAWINGGFFVLSPAVLDYIDSDATIWEHHPLETLAAERQLNAYVHEGFWQPMDTQRDRMQLEEMWQSGAAPWKSW